MTLDAFLDHWQLIEHPFRGEEARQDALFARMVETSVRAAAENPLRPSRMPRHPDYDKIAGDFSRPSTAVVFGEKGSGKTSIRLQMTTSAAAYNAANPTKRVLLINYDELAPVLQRLHDRVKTVKKGTESPVLESLKKLKLSDHVDAMLCAAVPRLVDAALEQTPADRPGGTPIDLGTDARKGIKKLDRTLKRDLMVLQVAYDRPELAAERTRELRKALGVRMPIGAWIEDALAFGGWLLPLGVFLLFQRSGAPTTDPTWVTVFFAAMGLWLIALLLRAGTERFGIRARARKLWKQVRVGGRSEGSFVRSVRALHPAWRHRAILPTTANEDVRLAMLGRLVRVLRQFGYESVVVLIDRVDEPPLIQGDPERMKAVIWPMLSNRFLQLEGVAFKMLLPIELRLALLRESSAFFQDARLDKQNMIEQLAWSGVALYDLCNQRLAACRPSPTGVGSESVTPSPQANAIGPLQLVDLFVADVTRDVLVEALEQVRQPRDAFKMLYQCIHEHCTHHTGDESSPEAFRIPRGVLESCKKAHVERLRQLAMGVRPA